MGQGETEPPILTFSLICSGIRSAWYVNTTGSIMETQQVAWSKTADKIEGFREYLLPFLPRPVVTAVVVGLIPSESESGAALSGSLNGFRAGGGS